MFVLEALVLTCMTTPLVTWLYPLHLRRRVSSAGVFDHVADNETNSSKKQEDFTQGDFKTRFTIVLDKLEHVPGMMALTQLVQPVALSSNGHKKPAGLNPSCSFGDAATSPRIITTEALRLIELSDRVSAVMKSSVSESLLRTDALLAIFRMFGQLNGIRVIPSLSVVKFEDLAYSVTEHARNHGSDMIFMPWLPPVHDTSTGDEHQTPTRTPTQPVVLPTTPAGPVPLRNPQSHNPFDLLFRSSTSAHHAAADMSNSVSITHSQFVRGVFAKSSTDVALFVDQSTLDSMPSIVGSDIGTEGRYEQHIFLPFFGGPDDRLALEFVVRICANPRIRGTVVRITKTEAVGSGAADEAVTAMPAPVQSHEDHLKRAEEMNNLTAGSVSSPKSPDGF